MRFQTPRGTEDVLPADVYRWRHLEELFRHVAAGYGYLEIRTPTFEDTELFTRSVGEGTDIVSKEMYEFKDKGGRSNTLKPEGTAPVMRSVIQHSLCPPGAVLRLFYVIPIFRYERPQKGRFREAHQVGLELIGSRSPRADAEIIAATVEFYRLLGLKDIVVSLNSIGRQQCREEFRQAVLAHMQPFLLDKDQDYRDRVEKNPLRLLDSKDPEVQTALKGLAPITAYLEPEGKAAFDSIQEILTLRGIPFALTPGVVRGLDYYTDTVFEVVSNALGAQNSLCGGGRYDDLVKELGGPPTPSVGVAMGIERALLVMQEQRIKVPQWRPDVFLIAATPEAVGACDDLAVALRAGDLSAVVDPDSKSLKSQLRQSDRVLARFALLIGTDELERGVVQVRDLDRSEQREIPLADIVSHLLEVK